MPDLRDEIKTTLQDFNSKPLRKSAITLLDILGYMRRFFLEWRDRVPQIAQTVTGQLRLPTPTGQSPTDQSAIFQTVTENFGAPPFLLSWTHYVELLGIKNPDVRSFYEIESRQSNWNVRELKRQKASCLYERLALNRDKVGIKRLAREGQIVTKPEDLFKEPLVLEFLGLDEQARYSESDLESSLITHLEKFLLELGKGFLFEARQKRFTIRPRKLSPKGRPTSPSRREGRNSVTRKSKNNAVSPSAPSCARTIASPQGTQEAQAMSCCNQFPTPHCRQSRCPSNYQY